MLQHDQHLQCHLSLINSNLHWMLCVQKFELTAPSVLEFIFTSLELSEPLCRVLRGMLRWAPGERYTMKQVLQEEYCQIPTGLAKEDDAAPAAKVRPEEVKGAPVTIEL